VEIRKITARGMYIYKYRSPDQNHSPKVNPEKKSVEKNLRKHFGIRKVTGQNTSLSKQNTSHPPTKLEQ